MQAKLFSSWMMRSTGFSALFGLLVGMIKVVHFIGAHAKNLDERIQGLLEGTGESLNNLTLGLLLITLSCLSLGVDQRRFPARARSLGEGARRQEEARQFHVDGGSEEWLLLGDDLATFAGGERGALLRLKIAAIGVVFETPRELDPQWAASSPP